VQLSQQVETKHKTSTEKDSHNSFVGLSAVLVASLSSGFAGVYFEKMLKESVTSIWIRNIQLAFFSIFLCAIPLITSDKQAISAHGFLQGYNMWAWASVFLQAFGGLLVAVVVKYADNILKGFATSVAIILSCLISVYLFGFQISILFCAGAILVIVSVYVYGTNPPPKEKAKKTPVRNTEKESLEDILK
jgi:UDP-sugar transporter A1/2/3